MKLIVINGAPMVGKSAFAEMCVKLNPPYVMNVSTVDFVKEVAMKCGWDGTKTPKNRAFLSDLKDLLTKWDNVPFKKVIHAIEVYQAELYSYDMPGEVIAFVHCREPQEIQKFVDKYNAITLCIQRPGFSAEGQSNHADSEVDNFAYDYYISNSGSLDDLQASAAAFMKKIKGED